MRVAVTCPLYVSNNIHRDFLDRTTNSISLTGTFIWIPVLNYVASQYRAIPYRFVQHPDETYEIEGRQPQSVGKGWTSGIEKAIEVKADYILVINDDIILKRDAIDRLVAFAELHPEFVLWSMGTLPDPFNIEYAELDENFSEHPCFSAYMVKPDFFTHVSKFDENIELGYFEDGICHAVIAMTNQKAVIYGGARFFHYGSRTINSDEDFRLTMPPHFKKNNDYFIHKCGANVINEVDEMRAKYYQHPYNIPELEWGKNDTIPDYWDFVNKNGRNSIHEVPREIVLSYLKERGLIYE